MSIKKIKSDLSIEEKLLLPTKTAQTALIIDSSGEVTHSSVTEAELGHLSGVTSSVLHANSSVTDLSDVTSAGSGSIISAAERTKLDGIEALADVTDSTNVEAAGAVMESDTTTASMSFVIDEDSMASDLDTKVPTQQSVKAYVDAQVSAAIAGGASYAGGYDASAAPSGTASVGDMFSVTVAGNGAGFFATQTLEVGDVIIAEVTNPASEADWTVVQKNLEAATETSAGYIEIATAAEVDAGTDNTRAITPAGLAASALQTKVDGIEAGADVTDATNVEAAGAVMETDTSTISMQFVIDEDTMVSDSATKVPTQQSVKAYVDSQAHAAVTLDAGATTQEAASLAGQELTLNQATTIADGVMSSEDKTKLDGIEANATADQTGAEIKSAYEAEADTNAFTDAEKSKLAAIDSGANAGANTNLSNLTALTSVNVDLLPAGSGVQSLGQPGLRWDEAIIKTKVEVGDTGTSSISLYNDGALFTPDAESGRGIGLRGPAGVNLHMFTQTQFSTDNSSLIKIQTGRVADGTSGSIELKTGTPTGTGSRGEVILNTDADKAKLTAQPTGADPLAIATTDFASNAGANKTLSNLDSPTAINQDILPDTGLTRNIGSQAKQFNTGHFFQKVSVGPDTEPAELRAGYATPSGATANGIDLITQLSNRELALTTQSKATNVQSEKILLESGNTVDGASGNIELRPGVPTGTGTRGKILLKSDINDVQLETQPDGAVELAVATTKYVDDKIAAAPSGSAGDIEETSQVLADAQATAVPVPSLAFAVGTVRSFKCQVSIERGATFEVYELMGIQKSASFEMAQESVGDDCGITFSITAAGQVQYTSTATGAAPTVKFRATTTTV